MGDSYSKFLSAGPSSIDNDMITLPPHKHSCEGWLLSSSTMIVSKSEFSKTQPLIPPPRCGLVIQKRTEHEQQFNLPMDTWRRPSLPETDPGMIEDLSGISDSEVSSDDDPFSYYASSSTSSRPPEKEEEVWNQYFHSVPNRSAPPPAHISHLPQPGYSLFPTPAAPPLKEYSHHPTHKSWPEQHWPQQHWPERYDSRCDRPARSRAQTNPSRPDTPSNLSFCTTANYHYPFSGPSTPSTYRHTHPPISQSNSMTPFILKSEFDTDSDDEDDEDSPNTMAKAIEEMFEKFRSSSGSSTAMTKLIHDEKPRRSKGGFRRSASEACEALKGVFSKKPHGGN